jgi:hypothetical protein
MEPRQILEQLGKSAELPVDAIRAARLNKSALVPEFIAILDAAADGKAAAEDSRELLFFAFHLLGEWREKSAFPTLLKFLCSPAAESLYDELCITAHRVMARVFAGDTQLLRALILDRGADEFMRSAMFETMALLTHVGAIRREETTAFLRTCFEAFQEEHDNFVWFGWQRTISLLGLGQLLHLVKEAFDQGFVDQDLYDFRNFERDFRFAVDNPEKLPVGCAPFDDVLEEILHWQAVSQEPADKYQDADDPPLHTVLHMLSEDERAILDAMTPEERDAFLAEIGRILNSEEPAWEAPAPAFNPHRNVGRNDPCPCGSGRKFKKCCLAQAA